MSVVLSMAAVGAAPIPWELGPGASNRVLCLRVPGGSTLHLGFSKDFSLALRQEQLLLGTLPVYFLDTWEIVQIFIYFENSDFGV